MSGERTVGGGGGDRGRGAGRQKTDVWTDGGHQAPPAVWRWRFNGHGLLNEPTHPERPAAKAVLVAGLFTK